MGIFPKVGGEYLKKIETTTQKNIFATWQFCKRNLFGMVSENVTLWHGYSWPPKSIHPRRLTDSRLEHVLMEVWFRSFSFLFMSDGCRWTSGSSSQGVFPTQFLQATRDLQGLGMILGHELNQSPGRLVIVFFKSQPWLVDLHPWKLTWNPKMKVWKMIFLFKQVIFRFHVNFPGCIIFW